MRAGEFSAATKAKIKNRAHGRCEIRTDVCQPFGDWRRMQTHHRRARGRGGSRDPRTVSVTNGLYTCAPCHDYVEQNRAWAYDRGFLVKPYGPDPALVPIRYSPTVTVYLHEDGTVQSASDTTHAREEAR